MTTEIEILTRIAETLDLISVLLVVVTTATIVRLIVKS